MRNEPTEKILLFAKSIFWTFILLGFVLYILQKTFRKKDIQWSIYRVAAAFVIGIALVLILEPQHLSANIKGFIVGLPLVIITYFIYAYLIKRPGKRKLEYQSQIEGLKMYMHAAEEKQLQHFNSPEITPAIFEALLPYAIALDMEKIWGEKFQKSLITSSTPETPPYYPPWYNGTYSDAGDFSHSLNSSLSNTVSHASTEPSSSSNDWDSGSFGGGFSGGGGGGGGVGGW